MGPKLFFNSKRNECKKESFDNKIVTHVITLV